ncbi:MAG TPA: carbon-nitrogen hydrolase family protein [Bryobacteraceae bacterium]|nr:carbon-nitrogen hydrolase family protein [Bryobacteraceae bacterium]HPT25499.1 carbon-nitrogen hydrolase family protein [Bryobacteraceae bacterium]
MNRRTLLTGIGSAAVGRAAVTASAHSNTLRTTSGLPPRKLIVGTSMRPFWVKHPGLEKRLDELTALIDGMHAESQRKFGRGVDLAILSETTVSGEAGGDAFACAVSLDGPFSNAFSRKAREHGCYVVAPTYLRESAKSCSNAAVLFGRKGELAGIYRKVHLVVSPDGKRMEGGSTPGKEFPVFDCDFGKLGIQICYDMEFDRGWQELARKGAELIAWPTQSPQTAQPAARALQDRCYIVSSTWRHNASVFEPTGKILAQLKPPGQVLAQEIDLSYAVLPWSSKLRNGKALEEKYGARIGYRYYEDEDCGIFWSNDLQMPVRRMVESLGLIEADEQLAQVRSAYRAAKVLDY